MILQIVNSIKGHYEIIESVIIKYKDIIGDQPIKKIYLKIDESDKMFKEYIQKKYPNIIFDLTIFNDFHINCTIYPHDYDMIKHLKKKYYFISHSIDPKLNNLDNVYYITPLGPRYLYADILPFNNQKNINKNYPIYVIQGNVDQNRRNFHLLYHILNQHYNFKFKIKIIGRGKLEEKFNKFKDKIIYVENKNFIDYHKSFLDCYCILPLILKKTQPQYYKTKLTSTINYAKAYQLKILIDKDLQNIYHLKDAEIFNNENDIIQAFKKTLFHFYTHIKQS